MRPYFLALLAEAHGEEPSQRKGLALLAEALDVIGKTGERFYEAELYRLKGDLLLARVLPVQGGKKQKPAPSVAEEARGKNEEVSEAEECFKQAIDIARCQQAKSLELRAAKSLSRLWQTQGKKSKPDSYWRRFMAGSLKGLTP